MNMEQLSATVKELGKKVLALPQHLTCPYSKSELLKSTAFFSKLERGYSLTIKLFPRLPLKYYLNDFICDIRTLSADETSFQSLKALWLETFARGTDAEKFFISKLFALCGVFDDDICRTLVRFAAETKNPDYRYWTTLDLNEATFLLQKGFYDSYFPDRRELLKQIAIEGNYIIPKKKERGDGKTIAIIAYVLSDDIYNSLQRVAMMLAKGLSSYFRVCVLTLDSYYVPKDIHGIQTVSFFQSFSSIEKKDAIDALFGEDASVKYVSSSDYRNRGQEFLNHLYELNPDLILDISDECSPLSYFYYKDFPTVYMTMKIGASSSFYSFATGRAERKMELNAKFHFMIGETIIDWSGLPEYVPPDTKPYSRRELGLRNEQFVVLTVGKCANCCNNSFVDELVDLLEQHKEMVWLIVGDSAPAYLHSRYPEMISNKRVIERKFERNLKALCRECDCLLRPDVTGGSGATAIAAMSGLPIAMTSFFCDPMRWLGRDFSTIDNYHDLALYIKRLVEDRGFYEAEREKSLALVSKATQAEEKWEYLSTVFTRIIEEGRP